MTGRVLSYIPKLTANRLMASLTIWFLLFRLFVLHLAGAEPELDDVFMYHLDHLEALDDRLMVLLRRLRIYARRINKP